MNILHQILCFTFLLAGHSSFCQAEIHKITHEDGRVEYTDSPPPDKKSEKVDVNPTNTVPAFQQNYRRKSTGNNGEQTAELMLTQPSNNEKFGPATHQVAISAQLNRKMNDGESFVFLINGEAINKPSTNPNTTLKLNWSRRGTHSVKAQLVNRQGKVLVSSQAKTIHVYRPKGQ